MIIPVRCFTCGKVIADKWEYYERECKKLTSAADIHRRVLTMEDLDAEEGRATQENNKGLNHFDPVLRGKVLDKLGMTKLCCRRMFLGHIDLVNDI